MNRYSKTQSFLHFNDIVKDMENNPFFSYKISFPKNTSLKNKKRIIDFIKQYRKKSDLKILYKTTDYLLFKNIRITISGIGKNIYNFLIEFAKEFNIKIDEKILEK